MDANCDRCGAELPPGTHKTCPECNYQFPQPRTVAPPPDTPAPPPPAARRHEIPTRRPPYLLFIAIIAIAGISLAAYLFLWKPGPSAAPAPQAQQEPSHPPTLRDHIEYFVGASIGRVTDGRSPKPRFIACALNRQTNTISIEFRANIGFMSNKKKLVLDSMKIFHSFFNHGLMNPYDGLTLYPVAEIKGKNGQKTEEQIGCFYLSRATARGIPWATITPDDFLKLLQTQKEFSLSDSL